MNLHTFSTFAEISWYAAICVENGVKSVYLSKNVYDRVKSVIRPLVGEQRFAGVKFKRKKCVEQ